MNRSDPDDMVIQSTSIILPLIQSPKFELDEEDEERMRGGSPQSILTGSSVTSGSSGRSKFKGINPCLLDVIILLGVVVVWQ